jgi:PX domain-containing protein kinase-like protein
MALSTNSSSSAGLNKNELDDTQSLKCQFLSTETVDDHVVYVLKVQRGLDPKYSWLIKKRYNEFNDLHSQLKISQFVLPLPPKKIFGNMKKEFLSIRQTGLQEFMEKVMDNLLLANSLPVKSFLDQENYSENFRESALAHVSMFVRSDSNWQVIEPFNDIGWRFRKQYILLKNPEQSNLRYILTWVCYASF